MLNKSMGKNHSKHKN